MCESFSSPSRAASTGTDCLPATRASSRQASTFSFWVALDLSTARSCASVAADAAAVVAASSAAARAKFSRLFPMMADSPSIPQFIVFYE